MDSGMLSVLIIVMLIAAVWGVQFWLTRPRTRRGEPLSSVAREALPDGIGADATLFFHSPSCGPCRSMMPHVRALAEERGDVWSLDVTQHLDAAMALGIRATPTLVVVRGGIVAQARTGFLSPTALQFLAAA